MAKTTCNKCHRQVMLARIDGQLVATDPELMSVVPTVESGQRMAAEAVLARRVHADRCEDYQNEARRARIAADQRAFNRKSKNRNHGL